MPGKDEEPFWTSLWREALLATTLGWDLAIPIFLGLLLGYYLDQVFKTVHTFTLGLLLMGIGMGYYNLWRAISRIDRKSKLEEEHRKQIEKDEKSR